MPETIAITGAAGYLGTALLRRLAGDPRVTCILAIDRREPSYQHPKIHPVQLNLTEGDGDTDGDLTNLFQQHQVTRAVHLAFRLEPNHDDRGTRAINVGGTQQVLAAAESVGLRQLVFASSSVVYGASPQHPPRIAEDYRLQATRQVQYTRDKIETEQLCQRFRETHPRTNVCVMRVVTIVGPGMNNFISRFLDRPLLLAPRGMDPPWQFVHEDDCAAAFGLALFSDRSGTYNVAADGTVPFSRILARPGKPVWRIPRRVMKGLTNLAWYSRLKSLTEIPGALIDFLCYVPVLDNGRLKAELAWRPEHDSWQAIDSYLSSRFPASREGRPAADHPPANKPQTNRPQANKPGANPPEAQRTASRLPAADHRGETELPRVAGSSGSS